MTATNNTNNNNDTNDTNDAVTRLAVLFLFIIGFQVLVSRVALERETKRRWQHALTGHGLVQASYVIPISWGITGLLLGAVGMVYIRRVHPDAYLQAVGGLLRPPELEPGRMPGAFYFLLGTALTCLWFDLDIARYAVECLALADPVAAFVGKSIPSPKLNATSSVAGFMGCFATACIIGYLMLEDATMFQISIGAFACSVAESMPIGNDNLLIPLITSIAMSWSNLLGGK